MGAADLNGSGFPDLFLSNDYGISELYVNEGGKRFVEMGEQAGVGRQPKSGMNAAFGDVLNRGDLAIYETNISQAGVLIQGNNLWVPMGGETLRFENLAGAMGVGSGRVEFWRAVWGFEQRWGTGSRFDKWVCFSRWKWEITGTIFLRLQAGIARLSLMQKLAADAGQESGRPIRPSAFG